MHYKTKEAAIKRYFKEEIPVSAEVIKADYHDAEPEDIAEIIDGVLLAITVKDKAPEPSSAYPSGRIAPPNKKLYDKWRGQWKATSKIKDAFSGAEKVIKWSFEYLESKPNRTGIPLSDSEADLFNTTRKMAQAGVPCEQLTPHGTKPEIIYDLSAEYKPQAI